jgi:hypothetical protein
MAEQEEQVVDENKRIRPQERARGQKIDVPHNMYLYQGLQF